MTSSEFRRELDARVALAGISVLPSVAAKLEAYFGLLRIWNSKLNLTSLPLSPASDETLDRLFVEPLIAAAHLPAHAHSLLDIGSGGGSPAIPLALAAKAAAQLVMIESRQRKAVFLREALRVTGLSGEVVVRRLEDLEKGRNAPPTADVISMRAVRLDDAGFLKLISLMNPGAELFLFRGGDAAPPPAPFSLTRRIPLPRNTELAIYTA